MPPELLSPREICSLSLESAYPEWRMVPSGTSCLPSVGFENVQRVNDVASTTAGPGDNVDDLSDELVEDSQLLAQALEDHALAG